jgi:two-component system, OmpR family, copper resistance phosphate regulon response regulator CusR
MSNPSAKRILIIEDEQKMAQLIRKALTEEGYVTDVANDGYVGKRMAVENEYDAIILDINIPLMNGYEVCREIRKVKSDIPVLMLTAFGALENKLSGFEVGADDYITKPFELKELFARIKVCLKRKEIKNKEESVLKFSNLEVDLRNKNVKRSGKLISLTAKEFLLLEFFMKNTGRVISKAELAENIWEITFDTGTNIIEVYVNYLRNKIDKGFFPKLIHTVVGMGYVMKEEQQ